MKNFITTTLFISALCISSLSHAEWGYAYNNFSKTYIVSDGKSSIQYKTEKSAKKATKALNKNDKKNGKKSNGFWNPREEFCADPQNDC